MTINPEDETSYTTQYHEAFLKYVENKYCAKDWQIAIIKPENAEGSNCFLSAKASGFRQSSFDPYDLCSDDDKYLATKSMPEMTPRRSHRGAPWLTARRIYLILPAEAPQNWGQVNPNLNDYHFYPMEISSRFWLPDITFWWRQQEDTHPKYADLFNVAWDIYSIIPHGVGVEASFSPGRAIIGWRQSETSSETLEEKVSVPLFAQANNSILEGSYTALDTTQTENELELKREVEERKLNRMDKVHDFM